ncbi:membrane protein [Thalassotalea loyana]|uniref:Membrane protein n=1 Tax=Thalassotalea loyana TaxID=280483 RepID=A0ABQ6HCI2_9GAMM|nr:isoprenylcysteine carboxylmethyltransferase family protein [Thalassotalea loyana]GLX85808.1 membrane protein [Thalassotalea loyana]
MKPHFLTLKIPPVALVIIVAVLMLTTSFLAGGAIELTLYRVVGIAVTLLLATYFCLAGVLAFRKAQTTVNPMAPESSSQLVDTGVYRISRNPMYVGFVFLLCSLATYLGHTFLIAFIPAFMLYMNKFQIIAEEQALGKIFGESYSSYLLRVRRWL